MRTYRMNMACWTFVTMAWAAISGTTFAQTSFQAGYECLCVPVSMLETADGGFFLVGTSGIGTKVMKIDAGGAMEWSKLIDGEIEYFDPYHSLVLSNGDLLIAGNTNWGSSEWKGILMRLTGDIGEVVWSTVYDPGSYTKIRKVVELPLGDLLIAGEVQGQWIGNMFFANVGADGTLGEVRRYNMTGVSGFETWEDGRSAWIGSDQFGIFDSDGVMVGYASPNGAVANCPRRIAARPDGSLLILSTGNYGQQHKLVLTKVAADLSYQWTANYTGPVFECGVDLRATPDGGCIITGTTEAANGTNQCGFLLKVDAFGEHEWSRAYCSTYEAISLQVCTDGGFALLGRCPIGLCAVRSDSLGYTSCGDSTLVWNTTLSTASGSMDTGFNSTPLDFLQTNVGPFVITPVDVPFTPLCATGIDDRSVPTDDMVVWPNPFTTDLWIRTESARPDQWPSAMRVFDTRGACVLQRSLGSGQNARMDVSGLPASLYLIEVTACNGNRRVFRSVKSGE